MDMQEHLCGTYKRPGENFASLQANYSRVMALLQVALQEDECIEFKSLISQETLFEKKKNILKHYNI